MHLVNYSGHGKVLPEISEEQRAKMVKNADLHRDLHCASPEPGLDGNRGRLEPGPTRLRRSAIALVYKFNTGQGYTPHRYKYVVVPVGSSTLSISGTCVFPAY